MPKGNLGKPLRKRFLGPLGLFAGFVDATGGGGWGPVGTPAMLASGRIEPRKVIGSIDTSEFLVAVAASLGFLFSLGSQGINCAWVAALLLGGVVAAPIAAWLVRHIPPRLLGSLVGGMIILTNTRSLLRSDWIDAPDAVRYAVYAVIFVVWAAAVVYSIRQYRQDRARESADAVAAEAEIQANVAAAELDAGEAVPRPAGRRPAPTPRRLGCTGSRPGRRSSCASRSGGSRAQRQARRRTAAGRARCQAQVSATESPSGRLGSPSSRARVVSTSHGGDGASSAGSHSGRCSHGCTPAPEQLGLGHRHPLGVAAGDLAAEVQQSAEGRHPGRPGGVDRAGPPRSAISTSQPARSRASTTAIGWSMASGTTTRPPRAMRSSHQPSR